MECDLAIGEGYYNGWTLFLVNSDTCTEASTNTKFEVTPKPKANTKPESQHPNLNLEHVFLGVHKHQS
jgi:hypothetical protein